MRFPLFGLGLAVFLLAASAVQAQQPPRITWQSILNTPVFESGLMRFADVDIAFAPKAPGPVTLYVKTPKGEQLAKFGFYDTYRMTDAVFARQAIENLSEYTFTPGIYALQYAVGNQAATQFVFKVEPLETSDDPFNPKSTYAFIGPWQQYAYLMFPEMRNFRKNADVEGVELHFWAGAQDKPSSVKKGNLIGQIFKDNEMIAHTRRTVGYLGNRQLEQNKMLFYTPHEKGKEVNAPAFEKADLLANDGTYIITVRRMEDKKIIRAWEVVVKGGEMVPLPETSLSYEKGHQIVVPRVYKKGANVFKMVEAFWIKRPSGG